MHNPKSALPPHMRKFRPPLPGGGIGSLNQNFGLRRKSERDYSPTNWDAYFTSKHDVQIDDNNVFRVYMHESPENEGHDLPVLLLLHGGGFSALTWSVFIKSLVELCHVRIMAIDIRGHGSSQTENDFDLSVRTLVDDITKILMKMFINNNNNSNEDNEQTMPELILMGHSMGGALAAHFVDKCEEKTIANNVVGLIVIDVVEGTAKEALSQMQQVLRSRPAGFKSIQHAIEWCIRSNQVKNLEAAKISMPGQIKNSQTGICAADLIETELEQHSTATSSSSADSSLSTPAGLATLNENHDPETSESDRCPKSSNQNNQGESDQIHSLNPFVWRIDLSKTEPFWMEWFDNLSKIFLSSKGGAKMLLLAGVDRLDGPMTVGQMQGKFQMQVLPKVGHIIQEDDPHSVAQVVASYLVRNRFSVSKVDFERPFPSC